MVKRHIHYSIQDMIINHRIYSFYLQLGLDDGWDKNDKWENFSIFTKISNLTGTALKDATILDVGCGTGDMAQFLSDKNIKEYMGVDIFEPAIEKAKERFPNHTFIAGDFLTLSIKKKFDFVFCSGAMTTKLDSDNYEIIKPWIMKMWRIAKKGVAFNFLLDNNLPDDILFLYNPNRVLEICRQSVPKANLQSITTDAGSGNRLQEMHVFLF